MYISTTLLVGQQKLEQQKQKNAQQKHSHAKCHFAHQHGLIKMLEFLDKPLLEMGAYNAPLWLVWNFACPAQEVFCLAFSNWFKERGLLDQENKPRSLWFKECGLLDHQNKPCSSWFKEHGLIKQVNRTRYSSLGLVGPAVLPDGPVTSK
mmetsp:Transcript_20044/g.41053  ORF Transcript_20044/g.41053 Transcript_20044/m.41053 type:complete len:150 (-) Transcript_20044:1752-2201(-)